MIIGIDASNIASGGGVTFVVEFMKAAIWKAHPEVQVVLWAHPSLEKRLTDQHLAQIRKIEIVRVPGGAFGRFLWAIFRMPRLALREKVDIVVGAGGNLLRRNSLPGVVMVINQLSFDRTARELFSWTSPLRWKLELLGWIQRKSLRDSSGAVFFSEYSLSSILKNGFIRLPAHTVIPLGLEARFMLVPKVRDLQKQKNIRLLYVSTIFPYKHQQAVIEAVHRLRQAGNPIQLELVGDGPKKYVCELEKYIESFRDAKQWVHWKGSVSHENMPSIYSSTDIFIYASSCEAFGSTLLEAMASGVPIVTSNRGPMQELLGESAVYFDPYDSRSIEAALLRILAIPPATLQEYVSATQTRVASFTWEATSSRLFSFIMEQVPPPIHDPAKLK